MRRKLARAALWLIVGLALVGDCVAGDRPLLLHYDGETYIAPNLVDYDQLHGLRGARLSSRMIYEDWAIWPPVRHDPIDVRTAGEVTPLAPPSSAHLLGTDDRGRDVMSRLIHGTRVSLFVGAGAALLSVALALLFALLAARWRALRGPVAVSCDAVSAVPAIVVVVAVQGLIGRGGIGWVVLLVAVPRAADTARIALAALDRALASDYAAAARAIGAGPDRVLLRHALPHALTQVWVAAALTAATAVLAEAALGYLGFGAPSPTPSWGELLRQARDNDFAWWLAVPPGLAIAGVAAALGALAQRR